MNDRQYEIKQESGVNELIHNFHLNIILYGK